MKKTKLSSAFYLERQNPLYEEVVEKLLNETFEKSSSQQRIKSGEVKDWINSLLNEG